MIDISYKNYFSATDQSRYQTANKNGKNRFNDTFKTKVIGDVVYIEDTSDGKDINWNEINKIPGKYALKDGESISYCWNGPGSAYKLYHAAESTDDHPVLVAKGVDEYGMYFEEKIDVRQINPYNTSKLELDALSYCKPGEYKMASNPYDCMEGQGKGLRERFNYVAGAQTLIKAWKRIGHAGQAAHWSRELNFLLGYTENTAKADSVENEYKVDVTLFEGISEEYKRNLELYCNAARERLAASMAQKCSEDLLELL